MLALLVVLAFVALTPYRIPSSAMEPTLSCAKGPASPGCLGNSSDRVLACRICLHFSSPSRGDIFVFKAPREAALKCGEGGTFVKRVIGLPGETVHETDKGFVLVKKPGSSQFVKLDEPYLPAASRRADSQHFGRTWTVPPDDYFMMGDNRAQSCNSRTWGAVPHANLIGPVGLQILAAVTHRLPRRRRRGPEGPSDTQPWPNTSWIHQRDDGEHAPADKDPEDGEAQPELSETAAAGAFLRRGHARKLSEPGRPAHAELREGRCGWASVTRMTSDPPRDAEGKRSARPRSPLPWQ